MQYPEGVIQGFDDRLCRCVPIGRFFCGIARIR